VKVRRGKRKTTAKIKDDDENDDENGEATKIERVLISVKPKIEHAVCVLGMRTVSSAIFGCIRARAFASGEDSVESRTGAVGLSLPVAIG
jgi:hypothetical protein